MGSLIDMAAGHYANMVQFVVCDAGGGTVDLIAYRLTSLAPLQVEESAVGTGGLCGSAFLNYRFEDHVRQRLGQERYINMREKKPKTWMMGLKYFEEFVKRNFNENEQQEVNVPFPGLADDEEAGLESGFFIMTADQVKAIFEPVIEQVVLLLEGQVNAIRERGGHVSGIILVGGFGQSNYLYDRLKSHFSDSVLPAHMTGDEPRHDSMELKQTKVEVMQPLYAWTAVVRGAVLRGLEGNMVLSRRSRCHYGTSYATVFDPAQHSVSERYWSPLWERWMVSDRMQWHIAKVSTPCSISCTSWAHVNVRAPRYLPTRPFPFTTLATSAPDNRSLWKTSWSLATTTTRRVPLSTASSPSAP